MITLTETQLLELNKLWFIFGNNGKKHTHANHRYIQNLIEHAEDTEEFYSNTDYSRHIKAGIDISKEILTDECVNEVKKILSLARKQ
jgi:hypothetical protein